MNPGIEIVGKLVYVLVLNTTSTVANAQSQSDDADLLLHGKQFQRQFMLLYIYCKLENPGAQTDRLKVADV